MEKAHQLADEINLRSGQKLLDFPLLQKACLHKKDLVAKLLGLFSQQTPGWIISLENSVRGGDIQKTREQCHTIIGATAAIHADACVDSLKILNDLVKENTNDRLREQKALDVAVRALQKTKEACDELLLACFSS